MTEQGGLLITFEGSEGVGKSTQIARLAERLQGGGREVILTREPGGTPLGEEVRHLLKHADAGTGMCPEAELLLFAASRAQHVREVINPAMHTGKVVLCDRFLDSTTVYQGVARRLSSESVRVINEFAIGQTMPDLTIVIDIPVEIGMQRIKNRHTDLPDRMEQENMEFYQQVRQGYLALAKQTPERFFVVDGAQEVDVISQQIWAKLSEKFLG